MTALGERIGRGTTEAFATPWEVCRDVAYPPNGGGLFDCSDCSDWWLDEDRGTSGRTVANAYVNFNQLWTLADAKQLHDELAWYWTEFNCDLRDGGGASDVPTYPFASSMPTNVEQGAPRTVGEAPWAKAMPDVTETRGAETVTLGANSLKGIAAAVPVNGLVPADLFAAVGGQDPAGAISPAEFEKVEIIGGKAYLGVSVYTSDTIMNPNWSVATNGVIEVPAPGKQGFFYLMSRPAAPSDGRPVIKPVEPTVGGPETVVIEK